MLDFKKRILLVEDEVIIAATTANVLSQDFDVKTALSGEEAVELVKSGKRIDLILMDINLGRGMDGTEAAQIIMRERHIPIVFLSSHAERAVVEKTEKITSYGYVLKNPGSTVLFASIRMAFRLFEARKAISENLNRYRVQAERLQSVLDSAGVGVWELNVRKNSLVSDENMLRLLGLGREHDNIELSSLMELVHPDDMMRVHAAMQSALNGGGGLDLKFRVVRHNGTLRHVRASGIVKLDSDGRAERVIGVCQDVRD